MMKQKILLFTVLLSFSFQMHAFDAVGHRIISEIAYEVGFNDPKYFTRCFTRHFNQTPSSLMGMSEEESL